MAAEKYWERVFFSVSYIEPNLVKRIREEKREEKSEGFSIKRAVLLPEC